jgi:hypothetical protein
MIFLAADEAAQAQATIEAAKIAAEAAISNAQIGAGATLISALPVVIGAYLAFINARKAIKREEKKEEEAKAALAVKLKFETGNAIQSVGQTLADYRGDFSKPVPISVLLLPESLRSTHDEKLAKLDLKVYEAIAFVKLRLNDYRRAKEPLQNLYRERGDDNPLVLKERPADVEELLNRANICNRSLQKLARRHTTLQRAVDSILGQTVPPQKFVRIVLSIPAANERISACSS